MRRFAGPAVATLLLVAGIGHSNSAHAERVLTDSEASKLTLDALTAEPVYHHTAYHRAYASVHRVSYTRHVTLASATGRHAAHGVSRQALIHNVVYHPKASAHHLHSRHRG